MQRRLFLTASAGAFALGLTGRFDAAAASRGAGDPAAEDAQHARQFDADRRYLALPQARVAYVEQGSGEAALFLHGFPLNGFQWRGAMARLAGGRRCIAPDLLGLGFTEVIPGAGVRPDDQVDMLVALLDQLGVAQVDLVANDSGGAVAQLLAVRHPERIRTLLLTNCDVEPDSPPPALLPVIELARQGTFPDTMLAPWLADKDLARSAEGLGGLCYSRPGYPTNPAIDTYLGPILRSSERKALANAYATGLDPNPLAGIEAALRQCRIPTRIVWGMRDTIFSSDSPAYLDGILPNSRGIRRVEEGKLFFPEEYPDLIAEEAARLWSRA